MKTVPRAIAGISAFVNDTAKIHFGLHQNRYMHEVYNVLRFVLYASLTHDSMMIKHLKRPPYEMISVN